MQKKMFAPELFRPSIVYPDGSYDQLLRRSAQRTPNHIAIIYHDLRLSYQEVVSMVNSIANSLYERGYRKGDHICLFTANRPEYIITFIAAASIGLVVSPMNPSYREREVGYQLENSEACMILVQSELAPIIQTVRAHKALPHLREIVVTGRTAPGELPDAIPFASLLRDSSPNEPPAVDIHGDDLLALPYSSGTTGLPKGTMLTHRNLIANNIQSNNVMYMSPSDIGLLFLPFYHIYGVMLTGGLLSSGSTQVIMERFDLQQSLELCACHHVSYYFAVPPVILALANAPIDLSPLRDIKYIFSGAAPLPINQAQKLQNRLVSGEVVQGYGLTEASPLTHSQPLRADLIRPASIGLPINDTEQKIVDLETGERELQVGEVGELVIRGPQVMKGYWKAPAETEQVLRNGWLYTGDVAYTDEEGFAYIVDRKKEMIKYHGFAVAPAELEALLLEYPAIREAAAIGIPDEEAGELIKCFVVPQPGQSIVSEEVLQFTNKKLAGYKRIHSIEVLEAIPKTASGKILRRELKEREKEQRSH